MLTPRQIQWAREHDWFGGLDAGRLIVVDRSCDGNGNFGEQVFEWRGTFEELREWAGY